MVRVADRAVLTVHHARASETVTLLDTINEAGRPGSDMVTPFEAMLVGVLSSHREPGTTQRVRVLAILERTAVVCPVGCVRLAGGDKALALLSDVFVTRAAIRWTGTTEELRFGHDGKVSARSCRRCPRCGLMDGETEFRAYRTSYCVACMRETSREWPQRRAAGVGRAA